MKNLFASLLIFFGMAAFTAQTTAPAQKKAVKKTEKKVTQVKTVTPSSATVSTDVKLKKDGTPDKRYKAAKTLKKDGTPDKRFKANR